MEPAEFLARLRRGLRRIVTLDGISRLVIAAGLGLVLLVLLDWLPQGHLPVAVRLLLLVVGLVAWAWFVWRRLLLPLRVDLGDQALARIAERRLPDCNGRLFSAVDGIVLSEPDRVALRALCTEASIGRLLRTDAMRVSVTGAITLCLALLGIGIAWQDAGIGVKRALMPWSDAAWPWARAFDARLRDEVIGSDQPVVVQIERTAGDGAGIELLWTDQTSGRSDRRIPDGLKGPWTEALTLPAGDYAFRVQAPDAAGVVLPLARVRERPGLRRLTVTVTPPAYTGLPTERIEGPGSLSVYPGTMLGLELDPRHGGDAIDHEVRLRFADQTPALSQDGARHRGELRILEAGDLVIDLVDRYRRSDGSTVELVARPEPRIAIAALQDLPPGVALTGINNNEQVTREAVLELAVEARDDLGLGRLELRSGISQQAGEERGAMAEVVMQVIRDFPGAVDQRETTRSVELAIAGLAAEGQRLHLRGRAEDRNDVTGPGVGESDELVLIVVSPEELRQELDRLLGEVRDRVGQADDQLATALDDPEKLPTAARGSRALARRAGEQLADVLRRWRANALDEEVLPMLEEVSGLVNQQAIERLDAVPDAGEQAPAIAREADRLLVEAESLLNQMLNSGDLARQLGSFLGRQELLNDATRQFLHDQLAGTSPKQTLELRQQDLAARQRELAQRLREWEHRLQATETEQFAPARELARQDQAANRLDQAAGALDAAATLSQAGTEQATATASMRKLLDLLRGGDRHAAMAQRLDDLAKAQEGIKEQLEGDQPPQELSEQQAALSEATGKVLEEMKAQEQMSEAADSVQAARGAQDQAQGAMAQGKKGSAAAAAGAAAALLREAQEKLAGKDQEKQEEDQDDNQAPPDVLALLRALLVEQQRVVADCLGLHERLMAARGDAAGEYVFEELAFRDKRDHRKAARLQEEVLLRLREEGLKHLQEMPIIVRALGRVDKALERSQQHLATPALGAEGVRLAMMALYELERLLAVVDSMPPPGQEPGSPSPGGGEGNPPPFPPRAQLALLKAEQELLRWLSAVRHPSDLTGHQEELLQLAELVAKQTRPGTRPQLLMQRALRAMASAHELLGEHRFGATLLSEQDAAVAAIHRLIEEAKSQQGQGEGKPREQPRNQGERMPEDQEQAQRRDGDSRPGGAAQKGEGDQQGGSATGATSANGNGDATAGGEATLVQLEQLGPWVPQLPPHVRAALQQALENGVPVEGIQLWRRYLELRREEDR